jgi:long-chain acyl-CoA synthetase
MHTTARSATGSAVHRGATTIGESFLAMVESRADAPAILNADLEVVLSWRDYGAAAGRVATGLAAQGLGQGDTLGLLLSNRPEFHLADAGALLLGATPFSMYNILGARAARPLGRRRRLPHRHHRGRVG